MRVRKRGGIREWAYEFHDLPIQTSIIDFIEGVRGVKRFVAFLVTGMLPCVYSSKEAGRVCWLPLG
jgi:hypothetical protein